MTYKLDDRMVGGAPIEQIVPVPLSLAALPVQPGFILATEDPVWGAGEFVFARAAGAIRQHGLCVMTPVWDATTRTIRYDMTEAPATANLGRPLFVAQCYGALTVGQYAWFMMSGNTPVNSNASVAADTVLGIAAAGQAGANVAGRQLLNARSVAPATQTVVKPVLSGASGQRVLQFREIEGFFVGGYVSGTGIPAGAFITNMDPSGRFIIISADLTADVVGNVTQTANNGTIFYNIVNLNRVFAQGAIT